MINFDLNNCYFSFFKLELFHNMTPNIKKKNDIYGVQNNHFELCHILTS